MSINRVIYTLRHFHTAFECRNRIHFRRGNNCDVLLRTVATFRDKSDLFKLRSISNDARNPGGLLFASVRTYCGFNNLGSNLFDVAMLSNIHIPMIRRGLNQQSNARSRRKKKGAQANADDALLNGKLRYRLNVMGADKVRAITEFFDGNKTIPEIISVEDAFSKARDLQLDVVCVALNAQIPVVRIVDYKKSVYVSKKKEKMKDKPKVLPSKEVKFKAGIEDGDLDRKIKQVIKYLEKGHSCQITVISAFKRAIQNNNIVNETYSKVYELLEDYVNEPQLAGKNQNWRRRSVTLRPKENLAKILQNEK